jgi:hypothetical protein
MVGKSIIKAAIGSELGRLSGEPSGSVIKTLAKIKKNPGPPE